MPTMVTPSVAVAERLCRPLSLYYVLVSSSCFCAGYLDNSMNFVEWSLGRTEMQMVFVGE